LAVEKPDLRDNIFREAGVIGYLQYYLHKQNNFNPLMGILKLLSNRPLYSKTVIGPLAFDGWAVTFGIARSGLRRLRPHPVLSLQY